MNKSSLIIKYFQKSDQLTVVKKEYQLTLLSFFQWLAANDKVNNDKTTKYFPNVSSRANIVAKEDGIISGIEEIEYLLKTHTSIFFKSNITDGVKFKREDIIAEIKGKSHEILAYERTILNILQRMSGITTQTNKFIKLIHPSYHNGSKTIFMTNARYSLHLSSESNILSFIAATRKTPWMSLDKKAVAVGGGLTHRLNLSDGILIKDNHLKLLSIEKAIRSVIGKGNDEAVKTPQWWPASKDSPGVGELDKQLIEIEVENNHQAHQAIKTFQKLNTNHFLALMFDNFTPLLAKQTLNNLKKEFDISSIIFEASGGINESNLLEWSKTGVDILSLGSLTHSTHTINISLEFVTK